MISEWRLREYGGFDYPVIEITDLISMTAFGYDFASLDLVEMPEAFSDALLEKMDYDDETVNLIRKAMENYVPTFNTDVTEKKILIGFCRYVGMLVQHYGNITQPKHIEISIIDAIDGVNGQPIFRVKDKFLFRVNPA